MLRVPAATAQSSTGTPHRPAVITCTASRLFRGQVRQVRLDAACFLLSTYASLQAVSAIETDLPDIAFSEEGLQRTAYDPSSNQNADSAADLHQRSQTDLIEPEGLLSSSSDIDSSSRDLSAASSHLSIDGIDASADSLGQQPSGQQRHAQDSMHAHASPTKPSTSYGPDTTNDAVAKPSMSYGPETTASINGAQLGADTDTSQQPTQGHAVSRDDLLIVMPSSVDRMPMVKASRGWRQGVRTYVAFEEDVDLKTAPQVFKVIHLIPTCCAAVNVTYA